LDSSLAVLCVLITLQAKVANCNVLTTSTTSTVFSTDIATNTFMHIAITTIIIYVGTTITVLVVIATIIFINIATTTIIIYVANTRGDRGRSRHGAGRDSLVFNVKTYYLSVF
jgi:hypothetical protein